MMFCTRAGIAAVKTVKITDTGKIRLGGACRLPVATADAGKIHPSRSPRPAPMGRRDLNPALPRDD